MKGKLGTVFRIETLKSDSRRDSSLRIFPRERERGKKEATRVAARQRGFRAEGMKCMGWDIR